MKTIPFIKMSAAGNDFIVIDAVKANLKKLALAACNRKTGIGADGLLVLEKSKKADYKMRIMNSDGSEAEMCGNGVRCLATYIVLSKKPKKKRFSIETLAGVIQNEVSGTIAAARLSDPKDYTEEISVDINGRMLKMSYIDTGVPHAVIFVDALQAMPVDTLGRAIRTHEAFQPRGANANFVEQCDEHTIHVRTYERGVEGETLACGTGSVASAIVTFLKSHSRVHDRPRIAMKVFPTSGETLSVSFDLVNGKATNVWLKGNVKVIARGEYCG